MESGICRVVMLTLIHDLFFSVSHADIFCIPLMHNHISDLLPPQRYIAALSVVTISNSTHVMRKRCSLLFP